jgi:Na+/proline symporter
MQKNLACKNLADAQKNMFVFCIYLVLINLAFLVLGALLYLYANRLGISIPEATDELYPKIAFYHLDTVAGVFFILGLIASTYASSDSALTALTTSFCVDFLQFEKRREHPDPYASESDQAAFAEAVDRRLRRQRTWVHLGFAATFVLIILALQAMRNEAVISLIFRIAGYTYGPLLGLYAFGLFTSLRVRDRLVLPVCIAAPALTWIIATGTKPWFDVGFLTILINGGLTFLGLWAIAREQE